MVFTTAIADGFELIRELCPICEPYVAPIERLVTAHPVTSTVVGGAAVAVARRAFAPIRQSFLGEVRSRI
jgi:hypothetical protein